MSRAYICCVFSALVLASCGGGGGSSGPKAPNEVPRTPQNTSTGPVEIRFTGAPLEPETANIGTGMPEREFDVGHTLSVWWEAYGYTADGSPAEGSFIYDSEVYLSENDTLEPDDKLLFSMECLAPSSGNQEYACSQYASFRCDYESGLSLSCLSLPLDHPVGFKDKRIDLSDFLNIVPKTANIIYKVCLNETEVCDLATTQIVLN